MVNPSTSLRINEDYSRPFFVGRGERSKRFKGVSWDGYLAALEPQIEVSEPKEVVIVHRTSSMSQQEHDILEQLARRVDWLQKKLVEKEKKTQEKESGYY